VSAEEEERSLQKESEGDGKENDPAPSKNARPQRNNGSDDRREIAKGGVNQELPVHGVARIKAPLRLGNPTPPNVDLYSEGGSIAPAMPENLLSKLRAAVRDVSDFPKPGIVFKDITPILKEGALFRASIEVFLQQCSGKKIDKIVGIDARGFLFGSAVAYALGIGFIPLRKKGRLPYRTESARYSLEYGEAEMELHIDAIERGEKIVLIDDLLATGGTSASAVTLIKKVGGDLIEAIFLIELEFLHGRKKLEATPVTSFLKY